MGEPPHAELAPDEHGHLHRRPFLEWGPLVVEMPVLRLFAAWWVSVIIGVGCIWIILAPTNQQSTNAAFAILGSLVTGWVTWLVREQADGDV